MEREEFLAQSVEKAGSSLKGLATLVTQSFEIESMTRNNCDTLKAKLNQIDGGCATEKQLNDGNGWNRDTHFDGSLTHYTNDNGGLYGTETSASPVDIVSYGQIKDYLEKVLGRYIQASGGVYHTYYGSCHVHNTVRYIRDNDRRSVTSVKLDYKKVYVNIANFLVKFMPVLKWLTMTDKEGGRGVRGSSYDLLNHDELFDWHERYGGEFGLSDNSISFLYNMSRDSYMRILGSSSAGVVHWENRMCDTTFNATHFAMWLSINKAITLFAIDFARKDYLLPVSQDEKRNSRSLMVHHRRGYKHVDRIKIDELYKEMVSYLAKYLKVLGSLDAIEVMDKLIKCPISQWIDENGYDMHWNTEMIERVFNTRNRASDDTLRNAFIKSIQFLEVKHAESLNDFLENMASHLNVETKKVKSLYQMFKRENVDIEFLGGRLVYLGD